MNVLAKSETLTKHMHNGITLCIPSLSSGHYSNCSTFGCQYAVSIVRAAGERYLFPVFLQVLTLTINRCLIEESQVHARENVFLSRVTGPARPTVGINVFACKLHLQIAIRVRFCLRGR